MGQGMLVGLGGGLPWPPPNTGPLGDPGGGGVKPPYDINNFGHNHNRNAQ